MILRNQDGGASPASASKSLVACHTRNTAMNTGKNITCIASQPSARADRSSMFQHTTDMHGPAADVLYGGSPLHWKNA